PGYCVELPPRLSDRALPKATQTTPVGARCCTAGRLDNAQDQKGTARRSSPSAHGTLPVRAAPTPPCLPCAPVCCPRRNAAHTIDSACSWVASAARAKPAQPSTSARACCPPC